MAIPARIMIIVITIIISSSENPAASKPRRVDALGRSVFLEPRAVISKDVMRSLPVGVLRPVDSHRLGLRIDVEDIASAPAGRIRVVLNGAQSPLCFPGHRIYRNFSQVAHLGGRV